MGLITLGPDTTFDYEFDFRTFVAFGEIKVVAGKSVLGVLHQLRCKNHGILLAIGAETRRIGLIP